MPYGGEVIERVPEQCPAGHRWIVPRPRGHAPTVLVGSRPCSCTASGGKAHRTFACCVGDCREVVLRPACSGDQVVRAIHT